MDGSVVSLSPSSSSAASSTSSSLSIGGGSDLEAGFSGSSAPFPMYGSSYFSGGGMRRRGSFKAMASPRSPRSGPRFFFDPVFDDEPGHFLDSCFLCKKPLGGHRDIFMYRGDTPFCSEECRQEQIEMDEAKEKKWKMTSSAKAAAAATRKENQPPSSSSNSGDSYVRAAAGTVVAG